MVYARYEDLDAFLGDTYALLQPHLLAHAHVLEDIKRAKSEPFYAGAVFDHNAPVLVALRVAKGPLRISSIAVPDRLPWKSICGDWLSQGGVQTIEGDGNLLSACLRQMPGDWRCVNTRALFRVQPSPDATHAPLGELKLAGEQELFFLPEWCAAATGLPVTLEPIAEQARGGQVYLYETPLPTTMLIHARDIGTMALLECLYTTPAHRNQGYAKAAISALSVYLQGRGYQGCALYVSGDASNAPWLPRLGLRKVCRLERWHSYDGRER